MSLSDDPHFTASGHKNGWGSQRPGIARNCYKHTKMFNSNQPWTLVHSNHPWTLVQLHYITVMARLILDARTSHRLFLFHISITFNIISFIHFYFFKFPLSFFLFHIFRTSNNQESCGREELPFSRVISPMLLLLLNLNRGPLDQLLFFLLMKGLHLKRWIIFSSHVCAIQIVGIFGPLLTPLA